MINKIKEIWFAAPVELSFLAGILLSLIIRILTGKGLIERIIELFYWS